MIPAAFLIHTDDKLHTCLYEPVLEAFQKLLYNNRRLSERSDECA